ncbi:unnamed protein product [Meloidogyne enterolobii]|uniref:Uncharacterized protein n=1 Tax=Meloidogyne enterolobii TaxID=390850 RepID=A0ACB0YHW3_MELEN
MKVPPPPSYDETTGTAPPLDDSANVYPPIPEFNDQTFPQPLMGIPPQNDDAPYSHPHPNVDQFLGPFPQQAYCPTCKQHTLTEVKYVSGLLTWILVFVFIIFGFVCCCCLIPFCVDSCKDCQHRCTQCYTYIGTYQRVFGSTRSNQGNVIIVRQN